MSPRARETYTLGYTPESLAFVSRRRAATDARFFTPLLRPGLRLLDVGCGPGTITLDLARIVRPGEVVGIDMHEEQFAPAQTAAAREGLPARFETGSVYELPFPDGSFDAAFSHALLEHLREPVRAAAEIRRALRPDGFLGVRAPDWGGFLLHPHSGEVARAIELYTGVQEANGGDTRTGRKLASVLRAAGFARATPSASYEVFPDPAYIAGFLAWGLERAAGAGPVPAGSSSEELRQAASALRAWGRAPDAFFAEAWGEAVGWKG